MRKKNQGIKVSVDRKQKVEAASGRGNKESRRLLLEWKF